MVAVLILALLVPALRAADNSACTNGDANGPQCDAKDTQALLQAKVTVDHGLTTIESDQGLGVGDRCTQNELIECEKTSDCFPGYSMYCLMREKGPSCLCEKIQDADTDADTQAETCSDCRQKDRVSLCDNRWKCVNQGDQCEGECQLCNQRLNDQCYKNEQTLKQAPTAAPTPAPTPAPTQAPTPAPTQATASSCPADGCNGCLWRGTCRTLAKFPYASSCLCESQRNQGVWCGAPDHTLSCPTDGCDGCWTSPGKCRTRASFPHIHRGKCEAHCGVWCVKDVKEQCDSFSTKSTCEGEGSRCWWNDKGFLCETTWVAP